MADGKKKNNRIIAVLLLVVVAVVLATVPYEGRTGVAWIQSWFSGAPTSTPEKSTVIPRGSPSSYSQEIVLEGRPKVDDGAAQAQPLDDLTDKDRDALEKLIRDAKKP